MQISLCRAKLRFWVPVRGQKPKVPQIREELFLAPRSSLSCFHALSSSHSSFETSPLLNGSGENQASNPALSSQKDVGLDSGASIFSHRAGSSKIVQPRRPSQSLRELGLGRVRDLIKDPPMSPAGNRTLGLWLLMQQLSTTLTTQSMFGFLDMVPAAQKVVCTTRTQQTRLVLPPLLPPPLSSSSFFFSLSLHISQNLGLSIIVGRIATNQASTMKEKSMKLKQVSQDQAQTKPTENPC